MVAICCARPRPRDLAGPFCAHGASPGHSGRDRPDHRSLPQLIACTGLASAAPIRNTGGDAASDALPRLLRSPRRTRPTRRPAPATLALGPRPGLQASRRLASSAPAPAAWPVRGPGEVWAPTPTRAALIPGIKRGGAAPSGDPRHRRQRRLAHALGAPCARSQIAYRPDPAAAAAPAGSSPIPATPPRGAPACFRPA